MLIWVLFWVVVTQRVTPCRYTDDLLGHGTSSQLAEQDLGRVGLAIGDYVTANAYFPLQSNTSHRAKALPAIVWLHPYSYSTGYTPAYGQAHIHEDLAAAVSTLGGTKHDTRFSLFDASSDVAVRAVFRDLSCWLLISLASVCACHKAALLSTHGK